METDQPSLPLQSYSTSSTSPILFDTLLLVFLRLVYFLLSRKFLLSTINPRLRDISQPEQPTSLLPLSTSTSTSTSNTALPRSRSDSTSHGGIGIEFGDDTEDESYLLSDMAMTPLSPNSPAGGIPRTDSYFNLHADNSNTGTPTTFAGPSSSSSSGLPQDGNNSSIEFHRLGQKLRQEAAAAIPKQVLQLSHGRSSGGGTKGIKKATRGLHRVSRILFSICFAESCNLLTLVIFHALGVLHSRSRRVNFSISLHVILAFILLVVPLVQCLLFTYRSRESSSASSTSTRGSSLSITSRLLISLIPFTLYIFLFTLIPPYITAVPITALPAPPPTSVFDADDPSSTDSTIDQAIVQWSTSGPEGWEEGGWLAPSLGRVVVLGVVTLGSLSGFGAVRSAWNYFEHINAGSRSLTDNDILKAERSLYRVRQDIITKKEELNRVLAPSGISTPSKGWMGRMFGSQGDNEAASLQAELDGLKAMESQVSKSLKAMKLRKRRQDFGQTFRGQMYNLLGYAFAIYCAARVLMCLPSLFWAPLTTSQASDETHQEGKGNTNGDWISFLLALAISQLPSDSIDIDVAVWSRGISLILTGILILSSLAQVMRSLSKVLRLTSKTVGAGFLLLSLGQLFATYVISLLVQLRTSLPPAPLDLSYVASNSTLTPFDPAANGNTYPDLSSQTDHSLLSTLPDFRVFGRLFDIMFLLAATCTALYRYIAMKVAGADDTGEAYRN
ncbi:hypothetical protein IAR55_001824 [Kwoniella newhampshirensis]|uniref:Abscisic acid G-protein coupled receptor-domain-containing protein n=1 Tax=Kwoniella newhampshirensis TaxID=1651941 RepID=A0AAW0Z3A5_9TREE